jgi:hypothetical protein
MRRMILILVCLIFASCQQPEDTFITPPENTAPAETPAEKPEEKQPETTKKTEPVYVLNTEWKVIRNETMSRSIETTDLLQEEIEAHNATTINDKWYLYVGYYPEIKDSPNCDIFIVDKVTYIPVAVDNGVGGTYDLTWNDYPPSVYGSAS